MSDSLEDVVDEPFGADLAKQDVLNEDLFGDEDEDDYHQPQRQSEQDRGGEDDEDDDALIDTDRDHTAAPGHAFEDDAPPAMAEPSKITAADRKARMAELVQRQRMAMAAADEEGPAEEGESSKRRRRPAQPDSAKRRKPDQASPAGAGEDLAGGDEENSEEFVENEADKGFIDDAGVEPRPTGSDDEYGGPPRPPPEEALEASEGDEDDVDKALKASKRKKVKHSEQQLQVEVDDLLAKMEAAAEDDFELMAKNAGIELGKDGGNFARDSSGQLVILSRHAKPPRAQPALNKFRMLGEVSEFVNQRKYHELFIASGGLGVLKAWLEPYMDGSLPNVRVRALVLKCCQILPIDTKRDDIKDNLKKSQLAKRVMFLTKCQDETAENKRLADSIVREWSSNIFYDPEMEAEKRRIKEEQQLAARQMALERARETAAAEAPKRLPRMGEPGYRVHAAIPQASKLDYLVNPGSKDLKEASNAPVRKPGDGVVMKKMREVLKKNKLTTARAMEPSVEGRGIVMYNQ